MTSPPSWGTVLGDQLKQFGSDALSMINPLTPFLEAADAAGKGNYIDALKQAPFMAMTVMPGAPKGVKPKSFFTRESAPSGASGHLPGFQGLTPEQMRAHIATVAPSHEAIAGLAGKPKRSSVEHGYYKPQEGPAERNPSRVSEYEGLVDPARADVASSLDEIMHVQNASPFHWFTPDPNGVARRFEGQHRVTKAENEAAQAATGGDAAAINTGDGFTASVPWEPGASLPEGMAAKAPFSSMTEVPGNYGGNYDDMAAAWKPSGTPLGSNTLTQRLGQRAENADMMGDVDALAGQGLGARAQAADDALGGAAGPGREDVANFRRDFDQMGLSGIMERIKRGEGFYPVVGAGLTLPFSQSDPGQ